MNTTTENRDPDVLEREIRDTQDEISRTVDRIGDQLTPRSILNALLDKAESNDIDGRALLDGARRNPLALAMLAGGAIWLISDSDAKLPSGMMHRDKSPKAKDTSDPHHRDYITHMERVDMLEGEDPAAYQRRRDIARANFLMCERRPDEDESSFRQRLDQMTDTFRERRHALRGQTSRAAGAASDSARSAASKTQDLFASNPLVGGLAAAAVGAILGSVVPLSETEEERLSGVGEKARDLAAEQKDRLSQSAREQKDHLVDKAEEFADRRSQGQQDRPAQSDGGGYEPTLQQAASHDGTMGQPGAGVGSPRQQSAQDGPVSGQRR